jgi:hypothetical protein
MTGSFSGGYVPFYEPSESNGSRAYYPTDPFRTVPSYLDYEDDEDDEEDDEYYFQQQDEAESRRQQLNFDTSVSWSPQYST